MMTSFLTNNNLILFFFIYICLVSAQSDSDTQSTTWTTTFVWLMAILNTLSIIPIILSLIHFTHSIITTRKEFPVNKPLVYIQYIVSIGAIISCISYGLFRSNLIFKNIHNQIGCGTIWALSLFGWAISRSLCLATFVFRIHLAFKGSALGIPTMFIFIRNPSSNSIPTRTI